MLALLVPLSGSIDPVVDRRGLQGRQKTTCKSRPGIYVALWVVWSVIVLESSFHAKL